MNKIKEYNSQIEASKELKVHNSNISSCCKEKVKTAGGFIFKFSE